ncbi:MAG: xanthan lyase, partial [Candidatus Cryptobacteroides sp.]
NPRPLVREEGSRKFSKGLSDRYIALWHSHGRYFEEKTGRWEWQRAPVFTTVEDMFTQSFVLPFLIPMLENAGAYIICPRERDIQNNEVICDNDPSFDGPRPQGLRLAGDFKESGKWPDAGTGFADSKPFYTGNDNPFRMGTSRKTDCVREQGGNASTIWTPDIPERGEYAVYISYTTLPNSSETAHYTVRHLGGETSFTVNQKMGGGTWIYLGTFEFGKGQEGCVRLDNGTPKGCAFRPGTAVTADAVRFGGGMGKIARGPKDSPVEEYQVSGLPSYAEGALYWMQWAGADTTVTRLHEDDYTNDFADRGPWVSMMTGGSRVNPKVEGKGIPVDLSLGFHTDAGLTQNDSIIGTLGIYTLKCDGSRKLPGGEDRMTARVLMHDVQSQVVDDIRKLFEPEWRRRQLWDRSYSESRTTGVPGILLELLSHQNFADMKYGLDPAFRFTASRAVYKGILKYLSSRYNCSYAVQPLPVNSFSAVIRDGGKAVLRWRATKDRLEPTAMPEGFILYTRVDGNGFDDGREIEAEPGEDGFWTYEVNLAQGHIHSFKIVAFNDGGKSFPSEILSAGIPESGFDASREVLIVNNFTRVSAPAWFDSIDTAGFDDRLDRGVPYLREINYIGEMYEWRRNKVWTDDDNPGFGGSYTDLAGKTVAGNSFDYPAVHGKSLLRAGYSFCSSSSEAFVRDSSRLHGFRFADIVCGKQVTTPSGPGGRVPDRFQVFPEGLRKSLTSFAMKGGNLIVSGSNIGTDLWDRVYPTPVDSIYQAEGQKFAREILGYRWLTNYGERGGEVIPVKSDKVQMKGQFSFNQNLSDRIYCVETPDGLLPEGKNASVFLRYGNTLIPSAVCNEGAGYRSVSIGFPIETINEEKSMDGLFRAIMEFLDKKN